MFELCMFSQIQSQIFIDFMGLLMHKKYCIAGKFGELTHFEHLAKESLANYRSANRLLIVSTNLNGFILVNHG